MPSTKYNVSVKGVMLIEGKIPLLKNERNEWELPGGNIDPGEQPIDCIIREGKEELNIDIEPLVILDSWKYKIFEDQDIEVVIVTYACKTQALKEDVIFSNEHKELGFFGIDEIENMNMPQGYKDSIFRANKLLSVVNQLKEPK